VLGGERVGLAVGPQDGTARADQNRGVVDHAARGAPFVGAEDDVDPQVAGDGLHRLGHGPGHLGDEVPELLDGAGRREAGGRGLGQDDELGAGVVDAPPHEVHALVEVLAHRLG
jgi:hypothetical protein